MIVSSGVKAFTPVGWPLPFKQDCGVSESVQSGRGVLGLFVVQRMVLPMNDRIRDQINWLVDVVLERAHDKRSIAWMGSLSRLISSVFAFCLYLGVVV